MSIQEYITIITSVVGIIISTLVLFVSLKIYKRENTINNENFIYQKKYDTCEKLFSYAVRYITAAENIQVMLSRPNRELSVDEEELDKREDIFTGIEEEFEVEYFKAIMILPENVMNAFEDLIYKADAWADIESYQAWEKNIKFYYTQLDKIDKLIKRDLHLKELNQGIYTRLGKGTKSRIKRDKPPR